MNSIVTKTVRFNELGGTPVGFSPSNMETAYGIFAEEVEETRQAVSTVEALARNPAAADMLTWPVATQILDGCVDTVVTAIGILYRMGLTAEQINEAFEVVADSNLSKFPQTEEEAVKSVASYENDLRYYEVDYKPVNGGFVVHGAKSDGTADYKILKGVGFVDPEKELHKLVGDIHIKGEVF